MSETKAPRGHRSGLGQVIRPEATPRTRHAIIPAVTVPFKCSERDWRGPLSEGIRHAVESQYRA